MHLAVALRLEPGRLSTGRERHIFGSQVNGWKGDVISCIQANIQYINHFHISGVPGRNEQE
jgi:hypothetical protein